MMTLFASQNKLVFSNSLIHIFKRFRRPLRRPTIRVLNEENSIKLHDKNSDNATSRADIFSHSLNNVNELLVDSLPSFHKKNEADFMNVAKNKNINYEKRQKFIDEGKFVLPEHIIYEQLRKGDPHLRLVLN